MATYCKQNHHEISKITSVAMQCKEHRPEIHINSYKLWPINLKLKLHILAFNLGRNLIQELINFILETTSVVQFYYFHTKQIFLPKK